MLMGIPSWGWIAILVIVGIAYAVVAKKAKEKKKAEELNN